MSFSPKIPFHHICRTLESLPDDDPAHQADRTDLEAVALRLLARYPDQLTGQIGSAMRSFSSRIFRSVKWDPQSIDRDILSIFQLWANDADFDHFLATRPLIENCLIEISRGVCQNPARQEKLLDATMVAPFYADLLSAVVSAHPQEASKDLWAAIEAPNTEITIALLLAGAKPLKAGMRARGYPPEIPNRMTSSHARMKIIAEHGPLSRYLQNTHPF